MSSSLCPTRDELAAFAVGSLTESALETIAGHVEDCIACDRVLQELDRLSDPVIAGLRRTSSAAGAAAPVNSPSVSGRLGDFQILREVGRGGMGVVYEAEQVSLRRRVALKVLMLHPAIDKSWVERFRREARAAGRLHHTNIVPIYETGEQNGLHYFAMQLIPGAGLDAVIRQLKRLAPAARSSEFTERRLASGTRNLLDDSVQAMLGTEVAVAPAVPEIPVATGAAVPSLAGADSPSVSRVRSRTGRAWRGWGPRRPMRSTTLIPRASCTATSSRRTCCWMPMARCGSPISAWPKGSPTPTTSPTAVTSWARFATRRQNGSREGLTRAATCTGWG